MTSFIFRETLMSHLLIWGNAYARIIRDRLGRVQGLKHKFWKWVALPGR